MSAPGRVVRGVAVVASGLVVAVGCAKRLEPGDPIPGLTREQMDMFTRGRAVFDSVFTQETGLGPLFNADACAECHEEPVIGGVGDEIEVHATHLLVNGFCDPLIELGGPVFQLEATDALQAALGIDAEPVPDIAERGMRSTPDLFGFGLLDAVPDATLLALADPDDADGNGISGRVARDFGGNVGRFGRKALTHSLLEFSQGAFPTEQGVTDPASPEEGSVGGQPLPPGVDPAPDPEIDAQSVRLADAFVRFLAPPTQLKLSKAGQRGRKVFTEVGCAGCHVPALRTGANPVEALSFKEVKAYSDLLLHDMGPELADICFGPVATRSEFRTEPLMGLRLADHFLHDGRAESIEEAILAHGGEAAAARSAFDALSPEDRQALLEFLRSL